MMDVPFRNRQRARAVEEREDVRMLQVGRRLAFRLAELSLNAVTTVEGPERKEGMHFAVKST